MLGKQVHGVELSEKRPDILVGNKNIQPSIRQQAMQGLDHQGQLATVIRVRMADEDAIELQRIETTAQKRARNPAPAIDQREALPRLQQVAGTGDIGLRLTGG